MFVVIDRATKYTTNNAAQFTYKLLAEHLRPKDKRLNLSASEALNAESYKIHTFDKKTQSFKASDTL